MVAGNLWQIFQFFIDINRNLLSTGKILIVPTINLINIKFSVFRLDLGNDSTHAAEREADINCQLS